MKQEYLILVLVLFQLKHFIVDFPLQTEYQYKNKGTYGHPGGIIHAYNHSILTALIIACVTQNLYLTITASLFDFITHYHIDYFKVRITKYFGWTPVNSEYWFWLLGFDQFLHQVVYIVIVFSIVGVQ